MENLNELKTELFKAIEEISEESDITHTLNSLFSICLDYKIKYNKNSLLSILDFVSSRTLIPVETLKSKDRHREIAEARQFYFVLARNRTKNSYARIGKEVNKDHATAWHGIKTVNNKFELTRKFNELFGENLPIPEKFNIHKVSKPEIPDVDVMQKISEAYIEQALPKLEESLFNERVSILPYSGFREHQR